jgi:hypothetical protein
MAAFTTNLKNTAGIKTAQGSSLLMLKEVNSTGAELDDSAWFSFPIIESSSLSNNVTEETIAGEGGETYTLDGGESERIFEGSIIQRDTAAIKFVRYDASGKYFSIVKERNRTAIDDMYQYDVIGIAKISSNWSEDLPNTSRTVTFSIQNNDSDLTVDITDLTIAATGFKADLSAEAAVIPADQGHMIIEAD